MWLVRGRVWEGDVLPPVLHAAQKLTVIADLHCGPVSLPLGQLLSAGGTFLCMKPY